MKNKFNSLRACCLLNIVSMLTIFNCNALVVYSEEINTSGPLLKVFGGVNLARDSDFNGSNQAFPSGEANLDTGTIVGFAGGYKFNKNFSAELEYSYRSNDLDSLKSTSGVDIAKNGDLASVAIMANGYYHLDFGDGWSPYIGLGIGFLQEIDSDVRYLDSSSQRDLEDEVFAWQAMIGAEVPIDQKWKLFGEGRFMSASSPEISNSNGSYDINYENFSLLLGVTFQF